MNYLSAVLHARDAAVAGGVCVGPPMGCGLIATAFRDDLSMAEYKITGMCQTCQDNMERYQAQQEAQDEKAYWAEKDYYCDDEPPF